MTTPQYIYCGSLRLTVEDAREYQRLIDIENLAQKAAIAVGDARLAKRCRQQKSYLYNCFKKRHVPEDTYQPDQPLTLAQRVARLEYLMGII